MIPKERLRLYPQLIYRALLAQLPPLKHRCILCLERTTQRLCGFCKQHFLFSSLHQCTSCALPLPHNSLACGECLKYQPDFDYTISPYLYQPPLSNLIINFKHKGDLLAGRVLTDLFIEFIQHYYAHHQLPYPDIIAPVPLHWLKHYQRGFNQSLFFADAISKAFTIPVITTKRKTVAIEQKGLSRKQRLRNLKDSFLVHSTLHGEQVAIIDDVMTTGATANTLAIALKKAGAGNVSIWALSRTARKGYSASHTR